MWATTGMPIVDHEVDGQKLHSISKGCGSSALFQGYGCPPCCAYHYVGQCPQHSQRQHSRSGNLSHSPWCCAAGTEHRYLQRCPEHASILSDVPLQQSFQSIRFWFDTRPTLRKTVEDRASQRSNEEVEMEIERRLKTIRKERPFGRRHICPETSMDVSDEQDVGLVILKYNQTYKSNNPADLAIQAAENIPEYAWYISAHLSEYAGVHRS